MEYAYIHVIIAVFIVGTAHYYFLKIFFTNSLNKTFIGDLDSAKKFLNSSSLISRTCSNKNLHVAFGISNPFTNSDASYHRDFRTAIKRTIRFNDEQWQRIKDIALETVSD